MSERQFVIVFTSGDPYLGNRWSKQSAAFRQAVKEAIGAEPTPLMRTEVLNTAVYLVAVAVSAEALLSAIVKRMPGGTFDLRKTYQAPDTVLVFEVGQDGAFTDGMARAAFRLFRR